jgi:hypothetical protein
MNKKLAVICLFLGCWNFARCAERPDRYELGVTTEVVVRSKISMISIRIDDKQVVQSPNLGSFPADQATISFQSFDIEKGDLREISVSLSLKKIEGLLSGGKETLKSGTIAAVVRPDNRLDLSITSPDNGTVSILLEGDQVKKVRKWILYCIDLRAGNVH